MRKRLTASCCPASNESHCAVPSRILMASIVDQALNDLEFCSAEKRPGSESMSRPISTVDALVSIAAYYSEPHSILIATTCGIRKKMHFSLCQLEDGTFIMHSRLGFPHPARGPSSVLIVAGGYVMLGLRLW
ncbi:hypothetical protein AC579_8869 [Pseudocercospora musae]|uniref:Uncharacterized protein n=1 Tax=Pseudocercospora musae TaxID=113226 RepID=A0A139IGZ3_9PEZI|nr:hypothetical protein AC579_8869 [Pseudocercospora musae]